MGHSPWGRKESDTTEVTEHTPEGSSKALLMGLVILGLPIGRATDSHPTTRCDIGHQNWINMLQVVQPLRAAGLDTVLARHTASSYPRPCKV